MSGPGPLVTSWAGRYTQSTEIFCGIGEVVFTKSYRLKQQQERLYRVGNWSLYWRAHKAEEEEKGILKERSNLKKHQISQALC